MANFGCGLKVLPDWSILKGQKMVGNAKDSKKWLTCWAVKISLGQKFETFTLVSVFFKEKGLRIRRKKTQWLQFRSFWHAKGIFQKVWQKAMLDLRYRVSVRICIWLCFGYVKKFLLLIFEMTFVFHKSKQA